MTALLNVEFEDETGVTRKLTRKEVLHYTQVVAGAGNETTGRLIGWLAKVLADHPDQRRAGRRGPLAAEPRGRRDAALRADRPARRPVDGKGFRELRHRRCPRAARCCCCSAPPTAIRAATAIPTRSTSTATTSAHTHLRQGGALLPRGQPGPAGGPRRARRAAQPVARMGHRSRDCANGADVDGARLGSLANAGGLTESARRLIRRARSLDSDAG